MSSGEYVTARGFMYKIAPRTTVIHSKQANRRQQVIQLAEIAKDNFRRFQRTPYRSLGQMATIVGQLAH
jgi:hypothetical protein